MMGIVQFIQSLFKSIIQLENLQNALEEHTIEYTEKEKELLSKMEDLYFEMSWTERDEIDAENNKEE